MSLYPLLQQSWKGIYWFHLVRLSIHLWWGSCPHFIFHNTPWIHPFNLYAFYQRTSEGVSSVDFFFQRVEFLLIFLPEVVGATPPGEPLHDLDHLWCPWPPVMTLSTLDVLDYLVVSLIWFLQFLGYTEFQETKAVDISALRWGDSWMLHQMMKGIWHWSC